MIQRILLSGLLALSTSLATAGDRAGNGGDNRPGDDAAAWFLGAEPIRYCIESSSEFSVNRIDLEQKTASAFKIWNDYIQKKKINDPIYNDSAFYNDQNFPVGRSPLIGNSKLLATCDGTEELTFYFGVESEDVKKYRTQYYNPSAFAQRVSYDGLKARGKGFIWVANDSSFSKGVPDWSQAYRLDGILLHEIGHVHGNSHLQGTIMQQELGGLVLESDFDISKAKAFFTQIDGQRELVYCSRCASNFVGDTALNLQTSAAFNLLVGREPAGKVNETLIDRRPQWFYEQYVLTLKDDHGEYDFPIENGWKTIGTVFGDSSVFKKAMSSSEKFPNIFEWASLSSNSESNLRKLTTKAGKKVSIILNRNMGIRAVSIETLDETNPIFLFLSRAPSL